MSDDDFVAREVRGDTDVVSVASLVVSMGNVDHDPTAHQVRREAGERIDSIADDRFGRGWWRHVAKRDLLLW